MPRPNMTQTQVGYVLECVECETTVLAVTTGGWLVYYCPKCHRLYEYAECRQIARLLTVRPKHKGGHRYEEDRATGDHP